MIPRFRGGPPPTGLLLLTLLCPRLKARTTTSMERAISNYRYFRIRRALSLSGPGARRHRSTGALSKLSNLPVRAQCGSKSWFPSLIRSYSSGQKGLRRVSSSIPPEEQSYGTQRAICANLDMRLSHQDQLDALEDIFQKLDELDSFYLGLHPTPRNMSSIQAERLYRIYYGITQNLAFGRKFPPTFDITVLFEKPLQRFLSEENVNSFYDIHSNGGFVPGGMDETNEVIERRRQRGLPVPEVETIIAGPNLGAALEEDATVPRIHTNTKQHVCVGGTFDHLHAGHKLLLSVCAAIAAEAGVEGGQITLGLASGPLLKEKAFKEYIQPFSIRELKVRRLMSLLEPSLQISISPLEDPFGPSITIANLTTLVVSRESEKGGKLVNEERLKCGLKEVDIRVVDLVGSSNNSTEGVGPLQKISSTDTRRYMSIMGSKS